MSVRINKFFIDLEGDKFMVNVDRSIGLFFCSSYVLFAKFLLGKWNTMKTSDVYKEKWFHGKISREEVKEFEQKSFFIHFSFSG